jgi:hypothetical protein
MIIKIVQHMIHVVHMDIVRIRLMVNGVVHVNFGGMEQYVMNKQIVENKLLHLAVYWLLLWDFFMVYKFFIGFVAKCDNENKIKKSKILSFVSFLFLF